MKKLPIGEQDFAFLRKNDYTYVDKTFYVHQLLAGSGRTFFLSRPRRFGKSLLLSTIKAVFEGKKELFEGLYIYDKINWQESYPVIHVDMSGMTKTTTEVFSNSLVHYLKRVGQREGIQLSAPSPAEQLFDLIEELHIKTGRRVVVLVDEYDKPIQDVLHQPDLAADIREILREFYTVLKKQSEKLQSVFLTGVSKISQVSIFSGLNNLKDLSLDERYAGICGYTQAELEANFKEYIGQLEASGSLDREQTLEKIRYWYNGYSWDGNTFVYNPYSTLLLFDTMQFDPHWFRTGTPTFLLQLMEQRQDFSPVLEDTIIVDRTFSDGQILERMDTVPLFFQTGYLTIKKRVGDNYELEIPNNEVKVSLSNFLLSRLTDRAEYEVKNLVEGFRKGLEREDPEEATRYLRRLFAHITYDTHLPYEAHYHALLQLTLLLMGVPSQSEVHTDKGRTDLVIRLQVLVYVVEIKYVKDPGQMKTALDEGMEQIKRKRYYERELDKGRRVWLLALAFTQGEIEYRIERYK